jgi:hypothetical protein
MFDRSVFTRPEPAAEEGHERGLEEVVGCDGEHEPIAASG